MLRRYPTQRRRFAGIVSQTTAGILVRTVTAMHPKSPAVSEPLATRVYVRGDLIAGKYRLRQVLGKGGMGEVWAAVNTHLDSPVAIKVIRTGTDNEEARQRLMHEARATARLRHRAIVRVFDVGETELGDPFIVMERLTGESFGRLLERRRTISGEQAVQIMLPILHALATAHSAGIVHRDVKPDNVFLEHTDGGLQPKLLDFGVVKLQREPFAGELTNTGTTLGSPFYMSPEQARGLVVDHRVDLWSAAVVLYEAVNGGMPFVADNYNALLRAIIEDAPRPLDEEQVDASLANIIMQGLRRESVERWQTADELGRALALWLAGQGIKTDITGNSIAATWLESDRVTLSALDVDSVPPPAPSSDEWLERAESGLDVTQPRESSIVERDLRRPATANSAWGRRGGLLAILFLLSAVLAFWGIDFLSSEEQAHEVSPTAAIAPVATAQLPDEARDVGDRDQSSRHAERASQTTSDEKAGRTLGQAAAEVTSDQAALAEGGGSPSKAALVPGQPTPRPARSSASRRSATPSKPRPSEVVPSPSPEPRPNPDLDLKDPF